MARAGRARQNRGLLQLVNLIAQLGLSPPITTVELDPFLLLPLVVFGDYRAKTKFVQRDSIT